MKTILMAGVVAAVGAVSAMPAVASHGRGSVLVPSIDGNGNLTIQATSFWRPTFVDEVNRVTIDRPDGTSFNLTLDPRVEDTSDMRFTRVDETGTTALGGGAGLYSISWSSCCRVSGIANASEGSTDTESSIFWDGVSAISPIAFDLQNVQPNVVRGDAYSDNLDVTSPDGFALSYSDTDLGPSGAIASQAPGFSINAAGQITIPGANTAAYSDNGTGNDGADVAFSGRIDASDGGDVVASVQFDWLFDAVDDDGTVNQVPNVGDVIVNAVVGDMLTIDIVGTDPDAADSVTLSLISFFGPGGAIAGGAFAPGTPGNPTTGTFSFDTTGFGIGTYIATIRGTDGSLTDQGTITINLSAVTTTPVIPLPAGGVLLLGGLGALAAMRRRRG